MTPTGTFLISSVYVIIYCNFVILMPDLLMRFRLLVYCLPALWVPSSRRREKEARPEARGRFFFFWENAFFEGETKTITNKLSSRHLHDLFTQLDKIQKDLETVNFHWFWQECMWTILNYSAKNLIYLLDLVFYNVKPCPKTYYECIALHYCIFKVITTVSAKV